MTITLNGTTGITNDGGYTGDGVIFADTTPSNTLVTTTGGNVGIGTASPATKLEVRGADAAARFRGSSTQYLDVIATSGGAVKLDANNGNSFVFAQNTAENARIDSSGSLLVNSTTNSLGGKLYVNGRSSSRGSAISLTPPSGGVENNFGEYFYTAQFYLASGAAVTLWDNTAFYSTQFFDIFIQNDFGPRYTQWFRGNCSGYSGGVTSLETNNASVGTLSFSAGTPGTGQCRVTFTNTSTTAQSSIQIWVKMYGTAGSAAAVSSSYLSLN